MNPQFYLYHNWTASPKRIKRHTIHYDYCTRCNYGAGMHNDAIQGRNGNWLGPFRTQIAAENHVNNIVGGALHYCYFCIIEKRIIKQKKSKTKPKSK